MEQYITPTAKEMATKSDELGVDHLKPALEYIGGFIERMDAYDLRDRMLNVDGKGLYEAYDGIPYVLNVNLLLKYLEEKLGYEVSAGYENTFRLYGITLKW